MLEREELDGMRIPAKEEGVRVLDWQNGELDRRGGGDDGHRHRSALGKVQFVGALGPETLDQVLGQKLAGGLRTAEILDQDGIHPLGTAGVRAVPETEVSGEGLSHGKGVSEHLTP